MVKVILLCLLSTSSIASVLDHGDLLFIQDIALTNSRYLNFGSNDRIKMDQVDNPATQHFLTLSANFLAGLGKNFQLESKISWTRSEMLGGGMDDSPRGSSNSYFNEFRLGLAHETFSFESIDLGFYFNYKHPGKRTPRAPMFVALNDFSEDLTLGTRLNWFHGYFSLHWDLAYIKRMGPPADQFSLQLNTPISFFRYWDFGLGATWLHTFSGLDLASSSFTEFANERYFPFDHKRERFLGWQIFVNKNLSERILVGLLYSRKIWGRNTNRGLTLQGSWGCFF